MVPNRTTGGSKAGTPMGAAGEAPEGEWCVLCDVVWCGAVGWLDSAAKALRVADSLCVCT